MPPDYRQYISPDKTFEYRGTGLAVEAACLGNHR